MTPVTRPPDPDPAEPVRKIRAPGMRDVALVLAELAGVCVRPIPVRRVDPETGEKKVVIIRCGSRRESVCKPCAHRCRRLRKQQAMEGWHLEEEPQITTREPTQDELAVMGYRADLTDARAQAVELGDDELVRELDAALDDAEAMLRAEGLRGTFSRRRTEGQSPRRVRSTRRRQDVANLPRKSVSSRTIGQVYEGNDGKTYRPSTFLTLTLPSYGPVTDGVPDHPETYDYRRAARDAIHFGALIDRFWQNLRRAVGWNVQYFACVEPQQRGAPHLHAAVRGTISRELIRQVAAGTYHQVWWPQHDEPVYFGGRLPIWDTTRDEPCFVDPDTLQPLRTWKQAVDAIATDPAAKPAHVIRFGDRLDVQGVVAGTEQAGRCLRYLVKYLTKSISECYEPTTDAAQQHVERMVRALRYEPCSPTCANWLRYGVQPKDPRPGLRPGHCRGKAHKAATLGYGGRRCLVSQKWSGRTLGEHSIRNRAHVMRTLGAVGITPDQQGEVSGDGRAKRYHWEPMSSRDPDYPDYVEMLLRSTAERQRWLGQYQEAQRKLSATDDQAAA